MSSATNIVRMTVQIVGTRPLLWHAFGPDAIPLEKQERTGVAGNDPEEWKKTVLVTKEGQLFVQPTYVFGCLRDAAKYTRSGKGSIMTKVAATLQIEDERVLTDRFMPEAELTQDSDLPVYMDVRSVRNPSTKARNVRYRVAASKGWQMGFTLLFDKTIVSRPEMLAVLSDAGTLVGIGDGRSVGFGRFTVEATSVAE